MSGNEAITLGNLQICPNCKIKLPYGIKYNSDSNDYKFWLECPNCHFLTDDVFIGKTNFTIKYPGDRQSNIEPQPAVPPPDNPPNIPMIFVDWTCFECNQVNPGFTVNGTGPLISFISE